MPSGHVPDASPAEDDMLSVDTGAYSCDLAVKSITGHRCWESLYLNLGTVLLVGLSFLCSDIRQTLDLWAFLIAQMVKNLPAMQVAWVRSLGQEDPLEKGMVTHSSILAWRIPWTE